MMFTADFKLGHYMKIPPRVMFFSQISAIVVAGTVQLGVQAWYAFRTLFVCSWADLHPKDVPNHPVSFLLPSLVIR
jgi:hypothetical protein